jgi:putative ABC transport system substrate-binding protein
MRRRDFFGVLGGAATWPLSAGAQARTRRIGVILSGLENDWEMQARLNALRQGLATHGWFEDRNYRFEIRWPGPNAEAIKRHTAELVSLAPDVIVAGQLVAARELKNATASIPIVFANLADPVGNGLIPSLANTGRNITGFTAFEFATSAKWLELLKELAPQVNRVAVAFGGPSTGTTGENFYKALTEIAISSAVELTPIRINNAAEIEPALNAFAQKPNGGLIGVADSGASNNRALLLQLAARHRLPGVYPFRFWAVDGGLAVYGIDIDDQYRRAAGYVDRILKGANPASLPVQAPDRFELIINLKTAKAQGIPISAVLLNRANEVIE